MLTPRPRGRAVGVESQWESVIGQLKKPKKNRIPQQQPESTNDCVRWCVAQVRFCLQPIWSGILALTGQHSRWGWLHNIWWRRGLLGGGFHATAQLPLIRPGCSRSCRAMRPKHVCDRFLSFRQPRRWIPPLFRGMSKASFLVWGTWDATVVFNSCFPCLAVFNSPHETNKQKKKDTASKLRSESRRPGFSARGQKPSRTVDMESHDARSAGESTIYIRHLVGLIHYLPHSPELDCGGEKNIYYHDPQRYIIHQCAPFAPFV